MQAVLTDNEIINQVLNGHQQAYATLVSRYQNYVFTIALRYIKNREDAEEVAQDIFIKTYRSLADFRGDSKFCTWLYTIVHTSCLSFLRKKKVVLHSLDDENVFMVAANHDSGMRADQVEKKSRQHMVNRAIEMLNADDAMIITLFYQSEQTLEEIAHAMGIEINTAKVRLHRARTRLREKMQRHFTAEVSEL